MSRGSQGLGLLIYHEDKVHANTFLLWKENSRYRSLCVNCTSPSPHTKMGASVVTANLQNCLSYAFLNGRLRQVSVQRPLVLKVRSLTPGGRA